MSESIANLVAMSIVFVFAVSVLLYTWRWSGASHEFDVWFPTKYQRTLVDRRNDSRSDWLALIRAVDEAIAKDMSPELIARLEGAKSNAKAMMDIDEYAIKAEKARIGDPKRFDALLDKWGDK